MGEVVKLGARKRTGRELEEYRRKERAKAARQRERTAVKTPHGYRSVCAKCERVFFSTYKGVLVCGGGELEDPGRRRQWQGGDCQHRLAERWNRPERWHTLAHFERWAEDVILDTDEAWELQGFHRLFLADVFKGYRQIWLMIAEGNTKTTTLAGLALYHIQHRQGGRVPVAASARDQAFEMYLQGQGMAERSPELRPVFDCLEGSRMIRCRAQASRMQVYASDDRTGDGVIYTLALVDELGRHRDMRMYRTWAGKKGKRAGAQIAGISAAGEPGSEFEVAKQAMRQLATERTDEAGYTRAATEDSVLHEYTLPEDAEPDDYEAVKLANPFDGITPESLKAKRADPTMTATHWMRMTCNRAVRGQNAAIGELAWLTCETTRWAEPGTPVWAGLDVAWVLDTTALVPFWPRDPEYRVIGQATILEPPRDGTHLDPHLVESALQELHEMNPIACLVMDTTKAEQLASWAESELGCEVVDRTQSNALAALDYERWMDAMRHGWLWHLADPELTRHVLNAIARGLPNDKTRFDRPVRARTATGTVQDLRVIDGLTAASQVHGVWAAELAEGAPVTEPLVAFV